MNQQGHLYTGCFLNQIAAHYNGNPAEADPLIVLQQFFEYGQLTEQIKAFDEYCCAALKEGYHWERGSPANALHLSARLELLLEAAYLVHENVASYRIEQPAIVTVPLTEFPMLLTAGEFTHPFHFLEPFFKEASLPQWKKRLNSFTLAALSNSSIAEEMDAVDMLNFIQQMKKLIYCASRLVSLLKRKNPS